MTTLTEQLRTLVAEHGLISLSITVYRRDDSSTYFGACAQSTGHFAHDDIFGDNESSVAVVVASAINELNAKRAYPAIVEEAEGL